jgi:hypothetical protein
MLNNDTAMRNRIQKYYLLYIFLLVTFSCSTTRQIGPKELNVDGDYIHKKTKTVFPNQIDSFHRTSISSFDKANDNVAATYKQIDDKFEISVTVNIYPAGEDFEGRLRDEYLSSLNSLTALINEEIQIEQFPVRHEGEDFICNGFKALIERERLNFSSLTLFECGQWFFKIRITSTGLESLQVNNFEELFIQNFNPSKLTAIKPLKPMANVYFSKVAFQDSTLLGSSMGSALRKIEWALDNIEEKELASGFPDIYLAMHLEAWKAFSSFSKEHELSKSEFTNSFLTNLDNLIASGFLAEYILEQYGFVMKTPEDIELDFSGFKKWKEKYIENFDLKQRFYIISYE